MNPLLPGHSGTTPEPTWNTSHNNQGTNEDGSQNDPHPEAGPFHGQTTRNVSLEGNHDMVTGVQRENLCQHDMVTGVQRENLCQHDMVTGVQRERVYDHDMVTGATEQIGNCHDMTGIHEEVT